MNRLIMDLFHSMGTAISSGVDAAEDEGDRAYFGSTNDLDMLKEVAKAYWNYCHKTGDYGEEGEFPE